MLFGIAVGGALGTLARWWIGGWAQRWSAEFPVGTLAINVGGSFLLGFLVRYLTQTPATPEIRAALTIGFCGGFTTFSTFAYEAARLLEDGSGGRAMMYALLSVLLSLGAVFAGFALARALLAPGR
ncbi:MAG TPA: fluoride efflux transporter CrcB [Gemmatimonadaceae bacterium]|nr:fluoride efflux transporter CrcB [Gemmatimonadaceae bacterium]